MLPKFDPICSPRQVQTLPVNHHPHTIIGLEALGHKKGGVITGQTMKAAIALKALAVASS